MSRVTVITGGSAGIGAAVAGVLVARDHRVVVAARDASRLGQVVAPLGASALAVQADMTRRADVHRVRDEAIAAFGHIDVWINNAGRGIVRSVLELTDQDVTEILDVNLRSALYGMQAVIPYFQERRRGHLINVSSFLARVPLAPYRSIYSASKAALNSLTTNLRMDLRASHPDVQVSLVMPGLVDTDFARNALGRTDAAPAAPPSAMRAQSADEVAVVIAEVIEHPVAEAYTNPASAEMARRYFDEIGAFVPLPS